MGTSICISESAMLTLHLLATASMAGLIWFVQMVHYPLFAAVGSGGFVEYEQLHQRRTSFVVGPLMAGEASTVLLQIPEHAALASGYDRARVNRLVRTNWVRTVGWSLRAVIAMLIVVQVVSA
jgi:hypothetical protein